MQLHLAQSRVTKAVRGHAPRSDRTKGVVPRALALAEHPSLVFPTGETGSWDEGGISNPIVRVYQGDDEERWYMWYTGRGTTATEVDAVIPAAGQIGVAVSSDGITWTRGTGVVEGNREHTDVGVVLTEDVENWWTLDTNAVAVSDVQIFSSGSVQNGIGVYWMFYTGCDYTPTDVPEGLPGMQAASSVEGLTSRPGLAMSQDGRNWARIEADHHTHAVLERGEDDAFDSLFIAGPQVLASGPRDMRMYYHTYDQSIKKYCIGLATSDDGFRWDKQGCVFEGGPAGAFDSRGAGARCVVRDFDTKKYLMFYEAFDDAGHVSIGMATSDDGLTAWKRRSTPVLQGSSQEGAWDSGSVGSPCAVSMAEGKWRLYYSGKAAAGLGAWDGVGLAFAETDAAEGVPAAFERRGAKAL